MKKFKKTLELIGIFIVVSIAMTVILGIYLKSRNPELDFKAVFDSISELESMVASQMTLIITILIAWKRKLIRLPECLKMSKEQWSKAALPLALGICWMVCEWFADELFGVEMPEEEIAEYDNISNSILGCLFTCLIAPLSEELLFREGFMGSMLRSKVNPWVAIILSAVLFGISHLNGWQGIPAISSGIIWGILYWKTGNIVITFIIHVINNTFSIVFDLMGMGAVSEETKIYNFIGGRNVGIAICCIFAIISLVLLVKFLKREKAIAQ